MMLARREMLAGAGLVIATAAIGVQMLHTEAPPLPHDLIPAGRDALILHAGDSAAIDFVRNLRSGTEPTRIGDQAVAVLASRGFARTGAVLDGARGKTVIALLGDGDAVVVETMLHARGCTGLTRRRYAGRALLTARL